jgi:hypothetical protein
VQPHHVIRISALILSLVDKGCRNGVILPSRFELAVRHHATGLPTGSNADVWVIKVTDHVRLCFGMLREFLFEQNADQVDRRRSKTSPFKRACTSSDTLFVNSIVSRMTMDLPAPSTTSLADSPSSGTGSCKASQASPAFAPTSLPKFTAPILHLPDADELDEKGIPLIFAKGRDVMDMLSARSNTSVATSVAETELYDTDGFPILDGQQHDENKRSPDGSDDKEDDEDEIQILDPKPKRRKQASAKPKGKAKASPKGKPPLAPAPSTPRATPKKAASPAASSKNSSKPPTDVVLLKPRVTGPTKESNSRSQLTAVQTAPDGSLRKVHVFTKFKNTWGKLVHAHVLQVSQAILEGSITKDDALAMREKLRPSSM